MLFPAGKLLIGEIQFPGFCLPGKFILDKFLQTCTKNCNNLILLSRKIVLNVKCPNPND